MLVVVKIARTFLRVNGHRSHFDSHRVVMIPGSLMIVAPVAANAKFSRRAASAADNIEFYLLTGTDPEPISVPHPKLLVDCLSNEIDQLVAKATSQNARDRFVDVKEFRFALD